ncbi:hypothetical protein FHX06_004195 [Rhizobium sp. BK512]|nr:hypothetical protein [Rhizobium sp. BK512]
MKKLLAHATFQASDIIDDGSASHQFAETELTISRRNFERHAQVTVTARRRDHCPRGENARTRNDAGIDGLFECEDRPAEIANSGKTPHQGVFGFGGGSGKDHAGIAGQKDLQGNRGVNRVPMRVDHAWHQDTIVAGDYDCIGGRRIVCGIDRDDPTFFHQDLRAVLQGIGFAVEKPDLVQKYF